MSLNSTTNRNDYLGNGATAVYPYSFKVFAQTDLLVTVANVAGVETTLTLTTDYTVDGVTNASGGNLTLVNAAQAWLTGGFLTSGFALTIRRVLPLTQETDIRNQGDFFPEIHEDQFDRAVMIEQQQQDLLDRSLRLPETEAGSSALVLPSEVDRANNFLAFDASGNPIASSGGVSSVPVSAFMETVLDDTTATAARTTLGFTGAAGTAATGNIEDLAVTTAKIAATAVTAAKLASDAVTTAKIIDEAVTLAKVLTSDRHPRNWIINGGFDFWQRGTSFSTISSGSYSADRFRYAKSVTSAVQAVSQSADVPTLADSGYQSRYSFLVDCTIADAAVAAGDRVEIGTSIEGFDWAQLKGKAVTLSFWVKATLIGTYCVAFRNNIDDRSYVATYSVAVTGTWEKKTIPLTLNPTGGTDDFTTGRGLQVVWSLMAGSTYQTTAGSWQTGDFSATSAQVNAAGDTANNFQLAQVMLNIGSVAAPFARAGGSIGGELALCQRYYEKSYDFTVPPATTTEVGAIGVRAATTNHVEPIAFKSQKRAVPTIGQYSVATGTVGMWRDQTAGVDRIQGATRVGTWGFASDTTASVDTNFMLGHFTADAEF